MKNQKASYNFRLGFVLSDGPHLHRAYLVTVCRLMKETAVPFSKVLISGYFGFRVTRMLK